MNGLIFSFFVATVAQGNASSEFCASAEALSSVENGRAIIREKGEGGADEAIALFRAALEKDDKCVQAWWELGWAYQLKGDWKEVLASWQKVKAMTPQFPDVEEQLAFAQRQMENKGTLDALPPVGKVKPRVVEPSEGEVLTVAAVGDVHMGTAWPEEKAQLPPKGATDLYESVAESLRQPDVTFGNLETVLADEGNSKKCGPRSNRCYAFRVPTAYAQVLKDVGFDVMSIANNHAGDFGPAGRQATIAALDKVGIAHSGPIGDLASFSAKGKKIAMVAFSFGADVYRIQEIELARKVVADLKRRHDLVWVSFHAGAEGAGAEKTPHGVEKFLKENRGDSRLFAHSMIDVGADLLLGHGPHVLRGMEIYKGRLILYSMGNFSTWETFGLSGTKGMTGIFQISLAPNGVVTRLEVQPITIEEPGRPRPDAQKRAISQLRNLSKADFGAELIDENGVWTR